MGGAVKVGFPQAAIAAARRVKGHCRRCGTLHVVFGPAPQVGAKADLRDRIRRSATEPTAQVMRLRSTARCTLFAVEVGLDWFWPPVVRPHTTKSQAPGSGVGTGGHLWNQRRPNAPNMPHHTRIAPGTQALSPTHPPIEVQPGRGGKGFATAPCSAKLQEAVPGSVLLMASHWPPEMLRRGATMSAASACRCRRGFYRLIRARCGMGCTTALCNWNAKATGGRKAGNTPGFAQGQGETGRGPSANGMAEGARL